MVIYVDTSEGKVSWIPPLTHLFLFTPRPSKMRQLRSGQLHMYAEVWEAQSSGAEWRPSSPPGKCYDPLECLSLIV